MVLQAQSHWMQALAHHFSRDTISDNVVSASFGANADKFKPQLEHARAASAPEYYPTTPSVGQHAGAESGGGRQHYNAGKADSNDDYTHFNSDQHMRS